MPPFKWRFSLVFYLLLVGCASPSLVTTVWGDSLLIAQAPQSAAPAAALSREGVIAAWIGADDRGVHHDTRSVGLDDVLAPTVTLPLPPRYPRSSQLVVGLGDRQHLLWLDANEDGETQLYNALLDGALSVLRGPTEVSDETTFRYNALADGAGGVLAAWSGGLPAEPTLTIEQIDYEGRPIQQVGSLNAGDYPVLFRAPDGLYLLWLDIRAQVVCFTPLRGAVSLLCQQPVPTVSIGSGDVLLNLGVGADRTHVYVFWNLDRMQDGFETWFASQPLGSNEWSAPQEIRFALLPDTTIQTGYNSGQVAAAQLSVGQDFALAAPLPTIGDSLPVAGQSGDRLGILYFQAGSVIGYQSIAAAHMLASPLLLSDRDRHLYVAWSDAVSSDYAELRLVSTR